MVRLHCSTRLLQCVNLQYKIEPRKSAVPPQAAKVPLNEYEFPSNKIANVQSQLEKLVEKNYYLHQSARDAYRYAAVLLSFPSCVTVSPGGIMAQAEVARALLSLMACNDATGQASVGRGQDNPTTAATRSGIAC